MNIVYSSDNNYSRHVGISVTSLFECNKDVQDITVYIIDNNISEENHNRLDRIAKKYNRKIEYIPFEKYKERLQLNNKWELPISAYARLFVGEMLPDNVDKVLYLDCDTIVCDSLSELWHIDMKGNTIASVEDVCSCLFWEETGIEHQFRYICSGVILIDLKKWRSINAQDKMIEYIDERKGVVRHHDQTILNGVFWNDCLIIPPKYDALTPTFIMSYENLKAYFKLWDKYYTKQEIKESIKRPAIIHYTSSNVGRPWENNKHPKAKIYQRYWKESEWKDAPWGEFVRTYDNVTRRTYWFYQHVPIKVISFAIRFTNKLRGLSK